MMTFTPGWEKPKLAVIPTEAELIVRRAGKSGNAQKTEGIHASQIKYAEKNNALREADAIFLTFFDEPSVRGAVQRAQAAFNHDPDIKALLADMISPTAKTVIDQGTHQAEDRHSGGFKLHFDVRRSDNLCFHFYVGQNPDATLKIIEISYMAAGTKIEELAA